MNTFLAIWRPLFFQTGNCLLCKRRERTTLRCSFLRRTHQPVLHHSHFQECPDQSEHSLVGHPPCDRVHQSVVIDPIKEFLKIKIHHPAMTLCDVLLRFGYRLMRRAFRPEPVAVFGERRVPSALQDLHHRLLDKSIQHRRDAKLSHPAVRLRYFYPSHRLRLVGPA